MVLGETIASFERDLFRRGLTPQQQEARLEQAAQAIENNERNREQVSRATVISNQGRHLIESEQQEIREAAAKFLSPEELAEFVLTVLERHFPNSMRTTTDSVQFVVVGSEDLHDALQGLLTAYPATHHGRVEVARFRNRLHQQRRLRISFVGESEGVEFVHARHPLMILARHTERGPLSETPWCSGEVPSAILDRSVMLVWAIGSLEGYANRAELLCASVDLATERVTPIPIEHAQKLLQAALPLADERLRGDIDLESYRTLLEQALLLEFDDVAQVFFERDKLLAEKAKSAVHSHARRQLTRNERQLAKDDLNASLRNMYLGWNRRIESETESKLEEIEMRSGTRSSLELVGLAVLTPQTGATSA